MKGHYFHIITNFRIYFKYSTIIGLVGILVAIVSSSISFANAANIYCTKEKINENLDTYCFGTDKKDSIAGNALDNNVVAKGGNDIVDLGAGEDGSCGGPGDDNISGGNGPDTVIGDEVHVFVLPSLDCGTGHGADQLFGGSGDDQLFHGDFILDGESPVILSDGHTDFIDCGPRDDTAWINTSVDHDITSNCEHVHAG